MRSWFTQIAQTIVFLALVLGFLAYVDQAAESPEDVMAAADRPDPRIPLESLDPCRLLVASVDQVPRRQLEVDRERISLRARTGR